MESFIRFLVSTVPLDIPDDPYIEEVGRGTPIALVIAVVLAAAALLYFFYFKKKKAVN